MCKMCKPWGEICDLGRSAEPAWPLPRLGQGARHEIERSFSIFRSQALVAWVIMLCQVHDAASAVLARGWVSQQRRNVPYNGKNRASPQSRVPNPQGLFVPQGLGLNKVSEAKGRQGVAPAKAMITRSLRCKRSRSAARSGT